MLSEYDGGKEVFMSNLKEATLRFIYVAAMRDAAIQGAFDGKKAWLWKDDDLSHRIVSEVLKPILDDVISETVKTQEAYDKKFINGCAQACEIVNDDRFTFGNAQKLINIFMKYCYITTYHGVSASLFQFCHCPMDGKMLRNAFDYAQKNLPSEIKENRSDYINGWGSLQFSSDATGEKCMNSKYEQFQNIIREICKGIVDPETSETIYPIEYDYIAWQS